MAIAYVGEIAGAAIKAAGTAVALPVTITVPANSQVLVSVISDNVAQFQSGVANGGITNQHLTMVDTKGNTWLKLSERDGAGGLNSDGNGTIVSLWWCHLRVALINGDSITCTIRSTRDAKAIAASIFSVAANKTLRLTYGVARTGASTTPTSDVVGGYAGTDTVLAYQMIGIEGVIGDTWTPDADYTANPFTRIATAGGADLTNVMLASLYAIDTTTNVNAKASPTSTITFRDWGTINIAFMEVDDVPPVPSGGGSLFGSLVRRP